MPLVLSKLSLLLTLDVQLFTSFSTQSFSWGRHYYPLTHGFSRGSAAGCVCLFMLSWPFSTICAFKGGILGSHSPFMAVDLLVTSVEPWMRSTLTMEIWLSQPLTTDFPSNHHNHPWGSERHVLEGIPFLILIKHQKTTGGLVNRSSEEILCLSQQWPATSLFSGNHLGPLKLKTPPGILTYLHNFCLSRHSRQVPALWFQAWDTWSTSATSSRRSASCRRPTSCCRWRFAACRRMVGRQRPKRCVTLFLYLFFLWCCSF